MPDSRQDVRRLRDRITKRGYQVDERAVADAMLRRPMMRLFLEPPSRGRRFAA